MRQSYKPPNVEKVKLKIIKKNALKKISLSISPIHQKKIYS